MEFWMKLMLLAGMMATIFIATAIPVSALSWWNTSWYNRNPISINISSGSITNFQVGINVSYASGMNTDFSDIRFISNCSSNGDVLNYWNETGVASQWTYFWVKIPTVNTTICMYYNNSAATSLANGEATFMFFDDFDDATLNWTKWQSTSHASYTESGTVMTMAVPGGAGALIQTAGTYSNFTWEVKAKNIATGNYFYAAIFHTSPATYAGNTHESVLAWAGNSLYLAVNGTTNSKSWGADVNNWYRFVSKWPTAGVANAYIYYYNNMSLAHSETTATPTTSSNLYLGMLQWVAGTSTVDFAFVRQNYNNLEASYSVGAMETNTAATANITLTISIAPATLYTNTNANISIFYNETSGRHANITLNVSVNGINITNSTMNFTDVTPPITLYYLVDSGNYSKHDSLNASVTVTTAIENSTATAGSIIQNSIPTTPAITFFPASAIIGDTLNATGHSTDADGDTLSYWFVWGYANGTNISTAWNASANFTISQGYENDTLRVYVMPYDGEANGTYNFTNFTVTHMAITLPLNGVEYIGSTLYFAFNFTAQATQNCSETVGAYIGNITTYALGMISSSQNHSRYTWYSNASYYNVTCFSSQNPARVYYKLMNFSNVFANWSVSIYTENEWDVPLTIAGANLSIFVNCEGGSQYVYNFTGTTITNVKPLCDVQSITAKVDYPSDSYTRERSVPSCTSCDIRMYMVDALVYTVLQIPIYMSDYNYFNSKVELYKLSGSNHYTIAEGFFDVEHKYVTYLTKDNTYYIRITKGSEVRDIGYLYAASATAQYLSLSSIRLVPSISLISDNLLMSAAFDNATAPTSVLRIQYEDLMNLTQTVRVQIFNDTSNAAWYDNTFTGISNLSIALNNINTSVRYSVHWTVHHAVLGNSPIDFTAGVGAFGRAVDLGLPASMNWVYAVVAFVIMLFTMFIIVPEIRLVGYLLLMVELGIFTFFTWFHFPLATVALFITFLAAGILYEMKYKGTT